METKTIYRLECEHHFWNFPTKAEAEKQKPLHNCKGGFCVKELLVILDKSGRVIVKEEKELK